MGKPYWTLWIGIANIAPIAGFFAIVFAILSIFFAWKEVGADVATIISCLFVSFLLALFAGVGLMMDEIHKIYMQKRED